MRFFILFIIGAIFAQYIMSTDEYRKAQELPPIPHKIMITPTVAKREKPVKKRSQVQQYICEKFGRYCETAIAVFTAESGLNPQAQGWNCWFDRVTGDVSTTGSWSTHRSGACPVTARDLAWSVDCGIAQLNVAGRVCPAEYFDPIWNIDHAYSWKFDNAIYKRTFAAWVAYTTGRHLAFMEKGGDR